MSAEDNEVKTLHHVTLDDNAVVVGVIVVVVVVVVVVVTRLGDFVSFVCFWGQ